MTTHAAPNPHPPHKTARRRKHHTWALVFAVVAVAGCVFAGLRGCNSAPNPNDVLLHQMQDAAGGVIVSPHVFGGELRRDGRAVVAEGVPANSCNEVGWVLGRQGPITVNGVLLPRLTASSLAELCRGNDAGASLSWSPRE